jgi:hypothetical protein
VTLLNRYIAFCTRYWYFFLPAVIVISVPFWFGDGTGSQQLDFVSGFVYAILFFGAAFGTANALQKRKTS